jgi:hypothetical protein
MSGPRLVKLAVFEVAELLLLHMSSASRVDPQTGVENSNGRKSREKPRSSRRHSQIPYDLNLTLPLLFGGIARSISLEYTSSDSPILTTLTHKLGQEHPTFAVAMVPIRGGGEIRVGDEVLID